MAAERIQRRLAAILAADVVAYSRLMAADEAGTLAALKAHRAELIDPKISEHNGRTVKLMGDGSLVEFASAVDAVECAAAIQGAMRSINAGRPEDKRIVFRIGINVGDIILEGKDIYGDGANVAARLEGIAEPGGIVISEDAWRQVRGKVTARFVDLGEQRLKNITRPVRVYRVDVGAWRSSGRRSRTRTTRSARATPRSTCATSCGVSRRSCAASAVSTFRRGSGINSGEVIVGKIGDDLRMDYTAQGQASALRVRVVDLANGMLRFERSRSLGHEGAPKTAAAARPVRLTTRNVEILRLRAEGSRTRQEAPKTLAF